MEQTHAGTPLLCRPEKMKEKVPSPFITGVRTRTLRYVKHYCVRRRGSPIGSDRIDRAQPGEELEAGVAGWFRPRALRVPTVCLGAPQRLFWCSSSRSARTEIYTTVYE